MISKNLYVFALLLVPTATLAQNQVVLKTQLPPPLFVGTPVPLHVGNLEPPTRGKRPDFYVPSGTLNLAKNKKVTASDSNPNVGTLDMIDDGDKDGNEGSWVELGPGKQWVQIDLAKKASISAIPPSAERPFQSRQRLQNAGKIAIQKSWEERECA